MIDNLQTTVTFAPPGHFYSPHPDLNEVEAQADRLFGPRPARLQGISLNEAEQLRLLQSFAGFYSELPWERDPKPPLRYSYGNGFFCEGDAISLYCMLRHLRPNRIIEIGGGFTSAVMLDTIDLFGLPTQEMTCVEPYPARLQSLLHAKESKCFRLLEQKLGDVGEALFETLDAGDILFVDSSHVSKIGSDVNRIFFEILPNLKHGVFIHFHDIFYPFEYPKAWIMEGRAWNESYLLRAFLQYNSVFQIIFFNSYLHCVHRDLIAKHLPLTARNPGGSIWLLKTP